MFFKTYVAAFFQAHESRPLRQLVDMAGMTDYQFLDERYRAALGIYDPAAEVVYGRWGPFGEVWARQDLLKAHTCLQIYFSMTHFHAQQGRQIEDLPLKYDPTLPMAQAFRDACEGLRPEVAFIDARAHEDDPSWVQMQGNRAGVLAWYPLVLGWEAEALTDEGFGLLYLNEFLVKLCDTAPSMGGRDTLPVRHGYLLFARRGWSRWG